jgi:DHA2 family multidrug resistance protein
LPFAFWEWRRDDPIVDLRLLKGRTFGIANLMLFTAGVVLYATSVLLQQFMQQLLGYTAQLAGMAISPGGFAIMLAMPLVGRLSSWVDGRKLIALGIAGLALALYHMTDLNLNVDFKTVELYRIYQSFAIAFLFIPINTMAYVDVHPNKHNQVSGIVNPFRILAEVSVSP